MSKIQVLDPITIDKIAAGEVIERPASVVKELVENAIDAGATAVVVEIKDGGISFMRITDNGCGIDREDVRSAFLRHSTSKIRSVDDLLHIGSLGFRGEALSSISAVAQVELITKTKDQTFGTLYRIAGGKEETLEDTGAPDGTTFIIRQLFYNTPARRKFLKTPMTEASHVGDLMTRLALSHPHISFQFINNGQSKLHTSGNGKLKDVIYHIYGREIASNLLQAEYDTPGLKITGFLGKPIISRGNRNFENYYVNGRYARNSIISRAIEDAYKDFTMQHKYPFVVLHIEIDGEHVDVNVHPTKMELRFSQNEEIYRSLFEIIRNTISHRDFIPEVPVTEEKKEMIPPVPKHTPEPFEIKRRNQDAFFEKMKQTSASPLTVQEENLFAKPLAAEAKTNTSKEPIAEINSEQPTLENNFKEIVSEIHDIESTPQETAPIYEQQNLEQLDSHFLTKDARKKHKIIGQLFDTYWLIEYEDKLFIIDQHAAHEKVLYERTMKKISEKTFTSQTISPPIILTLNQDEVQALETYEAQLSMFGYEIEPFGGKEYAITAIPADFTDIDMKTMFIEMLDDFANISGKDAPNLIMEKVASMSCKAAVKGNNHLARPEIEALIDELLELDNPYNCPHGRPTIISMTKYEIEKKFRRIV